jgi:SOS response regulatory protein OraA/RecX
MSTLRIRGIQEERINTNMETEGKEDNCENRNKSRKKFGKDMKFVCNKKKRQNKRTMSFGTEK